MDANELISVNSDDIECFLNVDGIDYCAYYTDELKEDVWFARVVIIDEANCFLKNIEDEEQLKVIEEYEKYEAFMNSRDELDEEEDY